MILITFSVVSASSGPPGRISDCSSRLLATDTACATLRNIAVASHLLCAIFGPIRTVVPLSTFYRSKQTSAHFRVRPKRLITLDGPPYTLWRALDPQVLDFPSRRYADAFVLCCVLPSHKIQASGDPHSGLPAGATVANTCCIRCRKVKGGERFQQGHSLRSNKHGSQGQRSQTSTRLQGHTARFHRLQLTIEPHPRALLHIHATVSHSRAERAERAHQAAIHRRQRVVSWIVAQLKRIDHHVVCRSRPGDQPPGYAGPEASRSVGL